MFKACHAIIIVLGLQACDTARQSNLSQVDATSGPPQLCPTDASACSDEGATRCVDGGLTTCIEVAGCLRWGVVAPCPSGTTCHEDGGAAACDASCPASTCTVPEARRCAPGAAASFERCVDDGAGCLTWSAPTACPQGETCGLGGQCGASCADVCAAGSERCEGDAIVTCGENDGDVCLEWGEPVPCPSSCALGRCIDRCANECATTGLSRCDGDRVEVCVDGPNGCRVWAAAESCGAGTSCSAGRCAAICVDECASDAVACDAGGVVTCIERDGDACRERSLPVACPDGQACSAGRCRPVGECVDECADIDERRCEPSGLYVEACGQYDADPCREWGRVTQCNAGATCSLGRCVAGCEDECEGTARRCRPGSVSDVETCAADGDDDPCREWVLTESCADDKVCSQGACAASCVDDCAAETSRCEGAAVVPCGAFDADACLDFGTASPCESFEVCIAEGDHAHCEDRPAPGELLISEILYNAVGDDDETFIELAGAPGMALAGFRLEAVNGDGGEVYRTLALSGVVPPDGIYVIAHPDASATLRDAADRQDSFADLQNGPDSLVVRWGERAVDAVGYGAFTSGDTFAGEGRATSDSGAGHSLARIQDTGDNLNDFAVVPAPTPGRPFLSAVRPTAFGDVVITEVMADPDALSDAAGEWFEVANPYPGATWDLGGCTLASDPAEKHVIQGPLLVPPGGRVVLARGPNPGFVPDYVYSGITLANPLDIVTITCDDVLIDDFAWLEQAPTGASMSVDPSMEDDAQDNDQPWAWCPAPVDGAPGHDAATPGDKNPPCPNQSGMYAEVALDTTWGACDEVSNWQAFSFDAAPDALEDATLSFEWWSVLCPLYTDKAEIWVELATGNTWVEVAHATLGNGALACTWLDASTTVPKANINAARAQSGAVEGRFRIAGGCPAGVGCGVLGEPVPYNCARAFALTYAY